MERVQIVYFFHEQPDTYVVSATTELFCSYCLGQAPTDRAARPETCPIR